VEKAIEVAKSYENVYLELCAVIDEREIIEKFLEEIGVDRILFGADFPWFNHHYYIGALIGSGIGESDLRKILYKNAEKLIKRRGGKNYSFLSFILFFSLDIQHLMKKES